MSLTLTIPIRTKTGLNSREHPLARKRRVEGERAAVALALRGKPLPAAEHFPVVVELVRISPRLADSDNAIGGLKSVRDQIATALGVDDGDQVRVRWLYRQEKGPFGVRVTIHERSRIETRIVPVTDLVNCRWGV